MSIAKGGPLGIEAGVPGGTVLTWIEVAESIVGMGLDRLRITVDIEIEDEATTTRVDGREGVGKGPDLTVPADPGQPHQACAVKVPGGKGIPIEQGGDLDLRVQEEETADMTINIARWTIRGSSKDIVLIRGHSKVHHVSITSHHSIEGLDHSVPQIQGKIHLLRGHRKRVFTLEMVEYIGWHQ